MENNDRRNILWSLAALLGAPLLLGSGALSRVLSRNLRWPAAGKTADLSETKPAVAIPSEPRPRINPPDHSVKRRV